MITVMQSAWLVEHPGWAITIGVLVVLFTAAALLWTNRHRFGPRARRVIRIAWLVWCGAWAFIWIAGGFVSTANSYSTAPIDSYSVGAAMIDLGIPAAFGAISISAMWIGKPRRKAHRPA